MEAKGLLGVIRMAAVNHEARYYMLRKARYPASRAEDTRRREVEGARSTAWALARNEGATLDSNGYPYSPTSPAPDTGNNISCLKEVLVLNKYSNLLFRQHCDVAGQSSLTLSCKTFSSAVEKALHSRYGWH